MDEKTIEVKDSESVATLECPHCKKKFWAKIGHAIKETGKIAVELGVSNLGAFGGSNE